MAFLKNVGNSLHKKCQILKSNFDLRWAYIKFSEILGLVNKSGLTPLFTKPKFGYMCTIVCYATEPGLHCWPILVMQQVGLDFCRRLLYKAQQQLQKRPNRPTESGRQEVATKPEPAKKYVRNQNSLLKYPSAAACRQTKLQRVGLLTDKKG